MRRGSGASRVWLLAAAAALTGAVVGTLNLTPSPPRTLATGAGSTPPSGTSRAATAAATTAPATTAPATTARPTGKPTALPTRQPAGQPSPQRHRWPDNRTISHVFYHSLVVDPARAFTGSQAAGYLDYMVTVTEFRAQLRQLYERGYVLVHPERIASPDIHGVMRQRAIMLPEGKKPLVLSIDDVSYYEYMDGHGFATDLFVDSAGLVRNHYTDAKGRVHVGSYDVVPIIDDFVRDHPDFSYHGDKGTLALTGYDGVFGYRSSTYEYGDTPRTRAQIAAAKRVARALKATVWTFASHTWGHIDLSTSSMSRIRWDARMWDREVRPIVGPTRSLIFAFGADIGGTAPYTRANPVFRFLHDSENFRYFFGINASTTHWIQLGRTTVRQARIDVDGISMGRALRTKRSPLWAFFDPRIGRERRR